MTLLLPEHLADLRRSGLTDATIRQAGFYSETDPAEISRILHWDRPASELGPCLVLPFFRLDGTRNGFARVKPSKQRANAGKYEQPKCVACRVLFTVSASEATRTPRQLLVVTEGEKKAWAAHQAGVHCIGLCGVWNWTVGQSDPRELIADLAGIDWAGRLVVIVFDTDERSNPHVTQARAELARVLTEHGAIVCLVDLPIIRGADGLVRKMGVDDFIVEFGGDAFRGLIDRAIESQTRPIEYRPLDDYRKEMVERRVASIDCPGVYLDTSPTGSGKTYADIPAAGRAETSLTVLSTHRECREVEKVYQRHGLPAEAYPELCRKTCTNHDEAVAAIDAGLSASSAVCPTCSAKDECEYRAGMEAADAAAHRIATHKRACLSLENIAEGRRYIAVHEDPTGLLRPVAEISSGLARVAEVARQAKDSARGRQDMNLYHFFWLMEEGAESLASKLQDANETTPLPIPAKIGKPAGVDAKLFAAMKSMDAYTCADPLRIVLGMAAGELAELVIRVDRIFGKGGQANVVRKSIIAVWQTELPGHAATWLNDATGDAAEIEAIAGRHVTDATPPGRLKQIHQAVQIPVDVKQSTAAGTVVKLLQGVLAAYPDAQRVGIITHQRHLPAIRGTAHNGPVLAESFRQRITKIEYFRNGASRGSNEWLEACDLIIVLGTPRVPPNVIKTRLIQTGRPLAAARDGEWVQDYWSGVTETSKRGTVRTSAYRDHDWHQAHRSMVRAELLQAVGRGRGICPNGLPVVVLSNEDLGLPLSELVIEPLSLPA